MGDSVVVFNEIMYHPATNEPTQEWVELYNQNSVNVDLSGWQLSKGISYNFPSGATIPAGGYVLVAISPAALMGQIGLTNVFGPFSGRLSNSGEKLELRDNNNRLMDTVTYGVSGDWPVGPDGGGVSLVKRNVNLASKPPQNWTAGLQIGGTPGAANFSSTPLTAPSHGILGITDTWSYEESGTDLGTGWRGPAFDDSTWASGPALFYAGSGDTPVSKNTPLTPGRTTYYFRRAFLMDNDPMKQLFSFRPIIQDGAVVYLNGTEIYRLNLPAGAVNYSTMAASATLNANWSGPFSIASSNLVQGTNVLAVELHISTGTTNAGLRVNRASGYNVTWDGKDGDFFAVGNPAPAPTNAALASRGVDVITSSNTNLAANLNDGRYGSTSSWSPAATDASPFIILRFNQTIACSSIAWSRDNGNTNEPACGGTCADRSLGNYTFQYTLAADPATVAVNSSNPSNGWTTIATIQYLSAQPGFTPSLRHRFDFTPTNGNPILATGIRLRLATTNTLDEIEVNTPSLPNVHAAFGLELTASDILPAPPHLTFNELSPASSNAFWLEVINHGDQPAELEGIQISRTAQGSPRYIFPAHTLAPGGILSLSQAQLGFGVGNGNKLFLYSRDGFLLLDAVTVQSSPQGRHPDGTGDWIMPALATPGGSNIFVPHNEIVFNEIMYHYRPFDPVPAVTSNSTLLPIDGLWRFNDTGTNLGAGWRASGYDDSAWLIGSALLYVSNSALPATANTHLAPGRSTYYFRTAFNFSGATSNVGLNLRSVVDDGAIFYLNGVEVYRLNMPAGPVTYGTSALAPVGNASFIGPVPLAGSNLVQGLNILAVEVHQFLGSVASTGLTLSGGGLRLVEEGPVLASAPMNLARQPGAAPFVIDSLAGSPIHSYLNLTDGLYGNSNSWIGNSGSPAFAGVRFGGLYSVSSFAFGRDNLGQFSDRTLGLYTLQYTRVTTPDVTTQVTSNADTGWAIVGTLNYHSTGTGFFTSPSLRHRYTFSAVTATGLRLVVPNSGPSAGACIDELEVNPPDTSGDVAFGAELVLTTIVVPATPFTASTEEWIELYNRSANPVDLNGWRIANGILYAFPAATVIPAGGYLVVANDAVALRAKWPEVGPGIVGNFTGKIGAGNTLILMDALGNPANSIQVFASGWSDGGGSSLELIDPRADNNTPDAWADSDETSRSAWQTITYRMASGQTFGNTFWNEFRLGLLDAGEVLVDDVSVIRDPDGVRQQLIQNGDFEGGGAHWRWLGDHRNSRIIPDPDNPANHVLLVCGTAPPRTSHNHIESSFAGNIAPVDGQEYEVSYRARWLAGSPQVGSSAYMQRLSRTAILTLPPRHGTPGAMNSRRLANAGPTFTDLKHTPIIPQTNQAVMVSVRATDPDGVASAALNYRINPGTNFASLAMSAQPDGTWAASIPALGAGTIVQFYISAGDTLGAAAFAPAKGPDSSALYQVADNQGASLPAHELRLIQLDRDRDFVLNATNVMSQGFAGGTLIYDRSEVFYDVGVRLHGSAAGRARDGDDYISYTVAFPPTHLFRGVQAEVNLDRSGRAPTVRWQDEIYIFQMFHHAGIVCQYADLCYFITPKTLHTGTAILQMAAYGGVFVQDQFNVPGAVLNYDITYEPSVTVNGNYEGVKLPVPNLAQVGTDFVDLGNDKEQYRSPFDMRHGAREDNFSGIMRLCQTFGLPQAQFDAQIGAALDVDEALRIAALTVLCGIGDIYFNPNGGLAHNLRLFTPSDGGRAHFLPWDMDFVFSASATSPIYAAPSYNFSKFNNNPATRRLYLGHVYDLCQSVFTPSYMAPWLAHYGSVVGQNYAGGSSYIAARQAFALAQLPAPQPFAITSNNGQDFLTNSATATITGTGWLDIGQLKLQGSTDLLAVAWSSVTNWQARVPLLLGTNPFTFVACDRAGNILGTRSITITTSATGGGVDTDGDGMPDVWELANGLNPYVDNANFDSDRDGYTDLQEYLAGTDPNDPHSLMHLDATNEPFNVRLSFLATAGRSYSVLYRTDPGNGPWSKLADAPPGITSHTVELLLPQAAPAGQRFYRLVTPQQP